MEINVDGRQERLLPYRQMYPCLSYKYYTCQLLAQKACLWHSLNPAAAMQLFVQFDHLTLQRGDFNFLL